MTLLIVLLSMGITVCCYYYFWMLSDKYMVFAILLLSVGVSVSLLGWLWAADPIRFVKEVCPVCPVLGHGITANAKQKQSSTECVNGYENKNTN